MDEFNDYSEKRLINTLTIDIETIPEGDKLSLDEMKKQAPKNYSKDEAITKWAEANVDSEYRNRALKSTKGRLLCIGVKWCENPVKIIKYNEDESIMIKEFGDYLKSLGKDLHTCAIVGHNIEKFDRLWLVHAAFKHNNKDILRLLPTEKFDKRLQDTSSMFFCGMYNMYISLKDLCGFFNIPSPKDDIDGSEVYDVFLNGELERIYTYCGKDVDRTRECWERMQIH